jgi:Legionella pneumophila major outer membrane protein precursor
MNMKKRFLTAMVASSLLAIGAVHADDCCNPCDPCYDSCYDPCQTDSCCWTGFEIGADFLYWKLCMDDLEYATCYDTVIDSNGNSAGSHNATYKHVCPDWDPGFRVYVGIDDVFCDWGLVGSYTRIQSCNSAATKQDGDKYLEAIYTHTYSLIGPTPAPSQDFVTMKQDLTYQSFDALFTTDYCMKSCHHFKPFFGVTGLYVDQDNRSTWMQTETNLTTHVGNTKWNSCLSGYGLRMGSTYSFSICDGLRLFGTGSAAITVADHDTSISFFKVDTTGENSTEYDYTFKDSECVFVPGYHLQIGFEYDTCMCGSDFGIRVGYEFLQWHNLPNARRFSSEGPPELSYSSSATVNTLGYHGLFAGLNVKF